MAVRALIFPRLVPGARFTSGAFPAPSRLQSTDRPTPQSTDRPQGRTESRCPELGDYTRSSVGSFFQDRPLLENPFLEDALLQKYLSRKLPSKILGPIEADLVRFGGRIVTELDELGLQCEESPPRLQHYDAWGYRVDRILTCPAWARMKEVSAQEGLIAAGYERTYGEWSRVFQMAKIYLFSPSSGLYTCPLAMTDGAAKVIETLGTMTPPLETAFQRLTSRDPRLFWTSGQWMTERRGGSDVANGTETLASPQADGTYRLYGFKWFTSATDANMTLSLARELDEGGFPKQGSRGLSLFYAEVRDEQGGLRGIEVQRLKNKLGTKQVPTAELLLDGLPALRMSSEGRGVASIASMLTITRIHNTVSAVAAMRRILQLARDYARKRFVFGKPLRDHALHIQTMTRMEVETRGAFLLLMELCHLLGREESGLASEREGHLLRLLTPVAKLYTGKQTVAVVSEGLECFGGQGYIEDTGLPRMLRDAQVLSIWEGTTNVLSLDVLRCLAKSNGRALEAFYSQVKEKLNTASGKQALVSAVTAVDCALAKLGHFVQEAAHGTPGFLELGARDLAYSLARIYMGALLIENAAWEGASSSDVYTATRWCERDLCPVVSNKDHGCYDPVTPDRDAMLVYEVGPHHGQSTAGE